MASDTQHEPFLRSNLLRSAVALLVCVCLAAIVIVASGRQAIYPIMGTFDSDHASIEIQNRDFSPQEGVIKVSLQHGANNEPALLVEGIAAGSSHVAYTPGPDSIVSVVVDVQVSPLGTVYIEGTTPGGWAALLAAAVWFLYVAVLSGRSFRWCFRYDLYSYRTVFDLGVCLSCIELCGMAAFILGTSFVLGFGLGPVSVSSMLVDNVQLFFSVTFPVLAVLLIGLAASNVALIRREGAGLRNMLGIALALLFAIGLLVVDVLPVTSGSKMEVETWGAVASTVACLMCYLECMLASVTVCAIAAARRKPSPDRDYTIVLGCAIRADGTPTPLLRGRCDGAVALWREQLGQGRRMAFVCSGGKGVDEVCSEAQSMAGYLRQQGVGEEDILLEDRSTNTLQNMAFSREVIEKHSGKAIDQVKVAFSTTNYHVFRAGMYAAGQGMAAQGIGCPTKWYFWPNAFLREAAGLFVAKKREHAAVVAFFVVANVALAIWNSIAF